jgi:hypothetical protein
MASNRSHTRLRRESRHLFGWAFGRAFLAYAFAQTYLSLYGPSPAVVPRLGMTVAALCGVAAAFGGSVSVALWFADWVEHLHQQWLPRLMGEGGTR